MKCPRRLKCPLFAKSERTVRFATLTQEIIEAFTVNDCLANKSTIVNSLQTFFPSCLLTDMTYRNYLQHVGGGGNGTGQFSVSERYPLWSPRDNPHSLQVTKGGTTNQFCHTQSKWPFRYSLIVCFLL